MKIIGLNKDNSRVIGFLMYNDFYQTEDGKWNFDELQGDLNLDLNLNVFNNLILNGKLTVEFGVVYKNIIINETNLKSLKGVPTKCLSLSVYNTYLTNIDYISECDNYNFSCNNIKTIDCKFPNNIERLNIADNINLESFVNFPESVDQLFINDCGFTSLEGIPETKLYLEVDGNPIKTLKGLENHKISYFSAEKCEIDNLEYCPYITNTADFSGTNIENLKGIKGSIESSIKLNSTKKLKTLEGIENIKVKTVYLTQSSIITLEHLNKECFNINCRNCPYLENVYIDHFDDDHGITYELNLISVPKLNSYTYFRYKSKKAKIKSPTVEQMFIFSCIDSYSVLLGNYIHEISEDKYYEILLQHCLTRDKLFELGENINWYGSTKKLVSNMLKSEKIINKFNL